MKVLITGVTGFRNRGVEALVLPLVAGLREQYPGVEFRIATWTTEYDDSRLAERSNRLEFVKDHYLESGSWGGGGELCSHSARFRNFGREVKSGIQRMLRSFRDTSAAALLPYEKPDLVILSGGDLISSDYGSESLRHFLEPVHWAHAHGIPCALIGQSIGKFRNEYDIRQWKEAEAKASLVTLREPLSRKYLIEELGSDPGKTIQSVDSAFMLEPDELASKAFRTNGKIPRVGLSLSQSICHWKGQDYDRHLYAWSEVVRMIIDDWGAQVFFIPHVQETYSDDRVICSKLWRLLGFDERVVLLGADMTAAEFKSVLASCEMVVAERMHAAIGAISSGVCTIPIGYSIKAEGIVTQIFEGTCIDPKSMVLPLEKFLDHEYSKCFLASAWHKRQEVAFMLKEKIPKLKVAAREDFQRICQLITNV